MTPEQNRIRMPRFTAWLDEWREVFGNVQVKYAFDGTEIAGKPIGGSDVNGTNSELHASSSAPQSGADNVDDTHMHIGHTVDPTDDW
jgi:hypothetical protein